MYLDFYGLVEKPFQTTPDPRFLYMTERHQEALAQLTYGVEDDQGFMVLTGTIGTGKTTLLNALRNQFNGTMASAFIANTMMPFDGLLEYMLEEFGVDNPGGSQAQRLVAFKRFLMERHRAGQKTVLIIDEAQNLSPETLEHVRLLSNFELSGAKLLRIVLVGQPELGATLALPELRQLRQRIALRFNIEALSPGETREYIRARLRIAGGVDRGIFTDHAIPRIFHYCRGIPRVINILCDHCLLIGYAEQKRRIEPQIVEEASVHLKNDSARAYRRAASRGAPSRSWSLWPWRRSPSPSRARHATG